MRKDDNEDLLQPVSQNKAKTNIPAIKRINSVPVILGCLVVGAILAVMIIGIYSSDKKNKEVQEKDEVNQFVNNTSDSESVLGEKKDIPVYQPASVIEVKVNDQDQQKNHEQNLVSKDNESVEPITQKKQPIYISDVSSSQSRGGGNKDTDDGNLVKQKWLESFNRAISDPVKTGTSFSAPTDSTNDVENRIELARQAVLDGANNLNSGSDNSSEVTNDSRWSQSETIKNPLSLLSIQVGTFISGTLITGINSDLPGQIEATVSRDVFDSPTGRYLLIPKGTHITGQYSSNIVFGQKRLLVAWQRLRFPDGKTLDIGSQQGTDTKGYSGFKDRVNNHFWQLLGNSLLLSFVVAGIDITQDDGGDSTNQRASDSLSEALGQQLGSVITNVINRNLDVSPTLIIRPGFKFNIIVSRDFSFDKPYQSFDYGD